MSDLSTQDEIRKLGIIYEDMQNNMEELLELVRGQNTYIKKIPTIEAAITELKSSLNAVNTAVSATNQDASALKAQTPKLGVV